MEKETKNYLAFLDVLTNNIDPTNLLTSVYRKMTFTGILTNFFSFTSFFYKLGLIRTLLEWAYKINRTLLGCAMVFCHEEVKKLSYMRKKMKVL